MKLDKEKLILKMQETAHKMIDVLNDSNLDFREMKFVLLSINEDFEDTVKTATGNVGLNIIKSLESDFMKERQINNNHHNSSLN